MPDGIRRTERRSRDARLRTALRLAAKAGRTTLMRYHTTSYASIPRRRSVVVLECTRPNVLRWDALLRCSGSSARPRLHGLWLAGNAGHATLEAEVPTQRSTSAGAEERSVIHDLFSRTGLTLRLAGSEALNRHRIVAARLSVPRFAAGRETAAGIFEAAGNWPAPDGPQISSFIHDSHGGAPGATTRRRPPRCGPPIAEARLLFEQFCA